MFTVRYEYKRKHILREKMTLRRHVLAGIRRTILAAGVLALIILILSSQDSANNISQSAISDVSSSQIGIYKIDRLEQAELFSTFTMKQIQPINNKYLSPLKKQQRKQKHFI